MKDNFTQEEVIAAKATRDAIIKANVPELAYVYMAGEVVMWADTKDKQISDNAKIVLCGYCKTPIHKDAYGGELKGIESFHTNCHIAEEMKKQYPLVQDGNKALGEGFVKKILALYTKEEISFGRMVELFNEQIANNFPADSFEQLFERHKKFAFERFIGSTMESSLKGLEREIKEVREEMRREKLGIEYADCLMYLLDSFNRCGFSFDELKLYFKQKLSINEYRDWNQNLDGSYSHKK